MMKKKVTIKDLSLQLNISTATISMILNKRNIERFAPETIQKVYQLAEDSGYRTKRQRSLSLVGPTDKLIFIICPSLFNPFYTTIIQGIESLARPKGYTTSIHTTYWNKATEAAIMEQAREMHVAGVIFTMIPQQTELAYKLGNDLPVVTIGDKQENLDLTSVDMDNYNAGVQIAEHLWAKGHKHIAYLSTTINQEHSSRLRRLEGLQAVYQQQADASLTVLSQNVTPEYELNTPEIEFQVGHTLTEKCRSHHPRVTAIVCINDMVAYGSAAALQEHKRNIPQAMALCGFDNIFPSKLPGLGLTTVDHALPLCGKSAFQLLLQAIDAAANPLQPSHITHVEYKSKLVIRQTT